MKARLAISVIVVTRDESRKIDRCLSALSDFEDVVVVDSGGTNTRQARVERFAWNGRYPKKRQWCLAHLTLTHEWVFFVDADEVVTPELVQELRTLDYSAAGYFVKGRYVAGGKPLKYGLCNNKLCLFDRRKIEFPVVDDLDIPGMGEIEGHYQPVLKPAFAGEKIGQVSAPVYHYADEDVAAWQFRHERYARWEAEMILRRAYPVEPSAARQRMKNIFRRLPFRPLAAFLHSYILKRGFMDGARGWVLAAQRFDYYTRVGRHLSSLRKTQGTPAAPTMSVSEARK